MPLLKISVETRYLVKTLGFASSVIEKRSLVNQLGHVRIVARKSFIEIHASDGELYLSQKMNARIMSLGEVIVSTQTLSEVVRKIDSSEIILEHSTESDALLINADRYSFELKVLPKCNFPYPDDISQDKLFSIKTKDIARLIERTIFATSTEQTRYNLTGIFIHGEEGSISSSATDAHRLSVANHKFDYNIDFGFILPRKASSELLKIAKDSLYKDAEMDVSMNLNRVQFSCSNFSLVSRLIDGTFPEYSNFIPKDNINKLKIDVRLLLDAIDRASVITADKFRAIKIILDSNALQVTAFGESKGKSNEIIATSEEEEKYCVFSGEDVSIGFNPKYITDVLNIISSKLVEIHLKDSSSPILVKSDDFPNDSFVIMPLKI